LQKIRALKALSFKKILENRILSVDAFSKLKNKHSSVKLTFSKCKISAVPLTNGSTDNGLINGQRKLCPALDISLRDSFLMVEHLTITSNQLVGCRDVFVEFEHNAISKPGRFTCIWFVGAL
jgi:hypothetical protein